MFQRKPGARRADAEHAAHHNQPLQQARNLAVQGEQQANVGQGTRGQQRDLARPLPDEPPQEPHGFVGRKRLRRAVRERS